MNLDKQGMAAAEWLKNAQFWVAKNRSAVCYVFVCSLALTSLGFLVNRFAVIVGIVIAAYLYYSYNDHSRQLSRLRLWLRVIAEDESPLHSPIKWWSLSLISIPHFLNTKSRYQAEIILGLGVLVIFHYQDVLGRKMKQYLVQDDYGYINSKKWDKEKHHFIANIIRTELFHEAGALAHELVTSDPYHRAMVLDQYFQEYWSAMIDHIASDYQDDLMPFDTGMTGHEYERYLAQVIRELGWQVTVTPGSGDHGADLIVYQNKTRVVIQCKLYTNRVGNKSVQEAYSAKDYYDCDYACVVTNSMFTPAARQAATKLGVTLLHHGELKSYLLAR